MGGNLNFEVCAQGIHARVTGRDDGLPTLKQAGAGWAQSHSQELLTSPSARAGGTGPRALRLRRELRPNATAELALTWFVGCG